MSKYVKPKCDCGAFLLATRSEYWRVTRAITKDGRISDKTVKIQTSFDDSDYEIKLYCPKCGKRYLSDYDEKDRIIKTELDR